MILRQLGLSPDATSAFLPIYCRWTAPDGVSVSITSALTDQKGAIGRCKEFAAQPAGDFWLPEFWDGGYYDQDHRRESPFAPLVWAPETYGLGVDEGDELASQGPASRPRLGIDLTAALDLHQRGDSPDWLASDGSLALRSQVWGSWKPDPDQRRARHHDDGEILWASPEWLDAALAGMKQQLVTTITLWKYKSSRDYDDSTGVKLVLVALRHKGGLRLWHAQKASKQEY